MPSTLCEQRGDWFLLMPVDWPRLPHVLSHWLAPPEALSPGPQATIERSSSNNERGGPTPSWAKAERARLTTARASPRWPCSSKVDAARKYRTSS